MAITNHERIGKCLEQLSVGLQPFVERELKSSYQDNWFAETRRTLSATQVDFLGTADKPEWDIASLLSTLWNQWNDVFKTVLGHTERSLVSELREVRNKWAHQRTFTTDDAYRALDSMERLVNAVSAPKEGEEIARHKAELLRLKFDEQARHERRKAAATVLEGQSVAGLRSWREVVTPHPDVASGRYQQAEFAADLWQVYKKRATSEYGDPIEFFRRTFLAAGLKDLLVRSVRRLAGQSADPVVELQTNFGGGKTHSMLALYHLFSGHQQKDFPGLEPVFEDAKCELAKGVRRVVIVGNKISPGQPDKKDDGTVVRTLWGELAWQLGGKEGYAMVKEADESIEHDKDQLGLDGFQMRQVTNQKTTWNTAVKGRIGETFCWLLFPSQPTSQSPLEWQAVKLSGPDPLAVRASKKLKSDTQMASQYAPTLLRQDLDKIPLWRGDGVSVKQLTEDYAKYPYLQRLRSPAVLVASIQDGWSRIAWTTETFAIADTWDEKRLRFVGLRANCNVLLDADSTALLVKPEVALRQLDAERPTSSPTTGAIATPGGQATTTSSPVDSGTQKPACGSDVGDSGPS